MASGYTTVGYASFTLTDNTTFTGWTSSDSTAYCYCEIVEEPASEAPPPKPQHRFPAPAVIAERTRPEWVAARQRTAARCRR